MSMDILKGCPKERVLFRAAACGHLGLIQGLFSAVPADQLVKETQLPTEDSSIVLPSSSYSSCVSSEEVTSLNLLKVDKAEKMAKAHVSTKDGTAATRVSYLKSSSTADLCRKMLFQQNSAGESALMVASKHGHIDVIKKILKLTPQNMLYDLLTLANNEGQNALTLAAKHGHEDIVRMLLWNLTPKQRYELLTFKSFDSMSALEFAICKGHCSSFSIMLDSILSANYLPEQHINSQSLLRLAIEHNQPANTDIVLRYTALEDKCKLLQESLASSCANHPHRRQEIKHLLKSISFASLADLLHKENDDGNSYLFSAVNHKQADSVILILDNVPLDLKEKLLQQQDKNGSTLLLLATDNGYLDIVKAIVNQLQPEELDKLLRLVDNDGNTPLLLAAYHGYADITRVLLRPLTVKLRYEHLISKNKFGDNMIFVAAKHDQSQVIRNIASFLSSDQINHLLLKPSRDGNAAILHASYCGCSNVVKFILDLANSTQKKELLMLHNNDGDTAISLAARKSHLSTIRCLLSAKAEFNIFPILKIQNKFGMTCVHHAAFHGFTEVLNELLGSASSQEKYELLSLEDDKGNIPLGGAVVGQHYKTVCAILSALEDVCRHKILSLLNDSKKTVLHIAAFKGFTDIADVLLASVSREEQLDLLFVHGSSSDVNTPIIEAIMQGHVDTFKHLMDLVDPSDRLRALLMHNHEGLLAPYTALTFGYSSMEQNILESLPDADRPHLAEQMHAKNTELPTEDANDSNVFTAGGIHSSDQVEKQIFKSVSDFHGETERSVPQIFECKPNIAVYETEEEEAAKRQIAGQITSVSETNPETSNGRLVRHNSSSFPVAWSSTYKQTIHDRSQTSDSPQQMDSDFSLFQESTACGGPQEERTVYELPMTSQQPEIEDSNAPTLPEDLQKDVQKKINIDLIMKYIFQPLNVLDSTSLYLTGKEASFQSPKKHVTPEVLIPFNMFSLEIGKHVKFEMFLTQSVEILNEFLIGRLRTKKQNCQCLNSNLHEIDPQILNKETSTPVDSRDNGLEADNPEESSDKPQKISQHQNSEQPEEEANKVTASLVHTSSENDSGSSDQGIADDVSSPSNPTALENCRNRPVQVNRDDQASLQCEGASASCLPAEGSEQHEKFRELTQAAGGRSQYTSESSKPGGDNKVLVDYSKWPQLRSMLMKIMEEHEIRAGTFDEDDGEIAVLMTDIEIKKQAVKEMKSAAQSYGYTLFAEELRCKGEELSLADLFKFALGNQKSDVEEFVFGTFDNPSSRLITKVRIIMQAKSRRDYNADKLRYFLLTPCHGLLSTEERQYKIEKPQDVEKHQEKMKKCVFKTFFDARHCMWVGSKANTLENEPRSVYRFLRARNEDFPGYASLLHDAMLIELERSEAKEIISYFKTRKTNPHLNSPEAGTSAEAVTCAGAVASAGSTSSIPKFEGDDVEIVPIDSRDELESLSLARHKISCNGKFGNLCPIPGFSYYYYVFGDHLLFQLDDGQTLEGGDCGALVYLEDGDGPKKKVLGQFIGEKESNSKRFPKYMAIALHWNLMHILKQKSSYLEDLQIALFWDPHIENVRVAAANQGNSLTAFPTNGDSGIGPSKGV